MLEMLSGDDDAEADALAASLAAVSLTAVAPPPALRPAPVVLIPAQFSAQDLVDLERVAAGLELQALPPGVDSPHLASPEAYEARIATLLAFADFLQAPLSATELVRAAGARGGRNRADWLRIDRDWALNCIAAARDAEARRLVAVDDALAETLVHTPVLAARPHDQRWLLHTGPRARAGVAPGTRVLHPHPAEAAAAALPDFVRDLLRAEAGHLALAGGAALAAVTAPALVPGGAGSAARYRPADYDLFIYGFTGEASDISAAADALVRRVAARPEVMHSSRGAIVSLAAVTLFVQPALPHDPYDVGGEFAVQFILRVARDPADILSGFDLAPAKVLLAYEPAAPGSPPVPKVWAAAEWVLAMRHGAYALDGSNWSRATALRVFKYMAKGFDALIPVLIYRTRIRYLLAQRSPKKWWRSDSVRIKHLDGFELLLALERYIGNHITHLMTQGRRRWQFSATPPHWVRIVESVREHARVDAADVKRAAGALRLAQRTDYLTAAKQLRNIWGILMWAPRAVLRWMGVSRPADSLAAPLPWRQPWSRSQMHPVAVPDVLNVLSLVDMPPEPPVPSR